MRCQCADQPTPSGPHRKGGDGAQQFGELARGARGELEVRALGEAGHLPEHLGGEHVGALLKDEDWYA